jgi:hypothetical protein
MRPCKFTFDDTPTFDGFTDDTHWNGFLNVCVTAAIHQDIVAYFRDL